MDPRDEPSHAPCILRLRPLLIQQTFEQLSQGTDANRFNEVAVEARFLGATPVLVPSPAGQGDDNQILAPFLLTKPAGRVVTVELRHADIEQHRRGPEVGGHFKCFETVERRRDFGPHELEEHFHALGRVAVIVDNQNAMG